MLLEREDIIKDLNNVSKEKDIEDTTMDEEAEEVMGTQPKTRMNTIGKMKIL